jgi:hypothetical protein
MPQIGAGPMSSGDKLKVEKYKIVTAREVFLWPEFKALCERLGVDYGAPITKINIDLPADGLTLVTVETYSLDTTQEK